MKLVHRDLQMQLKFVENEVIVWAIETPKLFRTYVEELWQQTEGREGEFMLSDNGKLLDIQKQMEFIFNPLDIQVNEKRCWNKICTQLKELAFAEQHYIQTQQLFAMIYQYFLSLEQDCEMEFSCDGEVDFMQLLKATGIKLEESNESLVEHLAQYIKGVARLLKKKIIVFVNLSSFLTKQELEELLKQAFYLKVYVILMETRKIDLEISKKCYIIDKDSCEIY